MNREEPYRSQAERLKQRIEKINEKNSDSREKLPPREQVHREKRKKTKLKLKYPVIRILVLFFILLPVVIFSVYSYLEGGEIKNTEKVSGDTNGYEVINFEKETTNKAEETKEEEPKDEKKEEPDAKTDISNEAVEVQEPVVPDSPALESTEAAAISPNGDGKNSSPKVETTKSSSSKVVYHTVKQGENLYRIALKYYGSKAGEDIIRKANNISGNEIRLGQVLKIPLNE
nr:LysM peptidoglycan-binding domain-containing protein [Neobacillus sp. Marseille-Q6967]